MSETRITRDDIERLREWRSGGVRADHAEWSASLIARLAALLPAESPPLLTVERGVLSALPPDLERDLQNRL